MDSVSYDADYEQFGYDALGHATLLSRQSNGDDSVINEVKRVYNRLGQLITQYQKRAEAVNTSGGAEGEYLPMRN